MPHFSIVVPAFNAELTLAETLDAVLAQTCDDWECVVVDDGSSDGTPLIAGGYAGRDPRFRLVRQGNQGSAGAYNAGVSSAFGDYIVLCSADDILLPEHLSRMSDFIDGENGYAIYSSNGYFWRSPDWRHLVYGPGRGETIHSLRLSDVILCCFYSVGAAYRRELFGTVGGYRLGVFGEDYDFWLRAMAAGARHRYLPEPLSLHRVSFEQKSANSVAAYRSDIRIVSDLRRDHALSPSEDSAVDECIRVREHLITMQERPPRFLSPERRAAAVRAAASLLGERRVRRLLRRLRALAGKARAG